jgi:hypothetical protein
MSRKVLILSLILLLGLSLTVFGAKKPVDEKSIQNVEKIKELEESITSKYLTTPEPKMLIPMTDDTVGWTYWDAQHDNSMRRQIANDYLGNLHFTWMNLVGPNLSEDRYIYYNARYPDGTWFNPGAGVPVTTPWGRGGYCGLDILPDSREVLAYHDIPNLTYSTLAIEKTIPGLGQFNKFDVADSGVTKEYLTWPYVACSKDTAGNTPYIHITNFSEDPDFCPKPPCTSHYYAGYQRCYEKAPDSLICQSPGWTDTIRVAAGYKLSPNGKNKRPYLFSGLISDGRIPYNAAPVATSPTGSGKVAIAWCDDAWDDFYNGEIYYVESTNNGQDWITDGSMWPPNQITNYGTNGWQDYWTIFSELAAVYDYLDRLHIFWTTCDAGNVHSRTLWHYSPAFGTQDTVASRLVTADCGDSNYAIAKPTAGVEYMVGDTAYNYLYVVYAGYSDDDVSLAGFANADIYKKVSATGGRNWGPEVNLTNTQTDGCDFGDCESEAWPSVAERVDSFMYVSYVYDLDASGAINSEGGYTMNPIRYLRDRRQLVPAIPLKVFTPTQMASPVRWATNGGSMQDTIRFKNIGTATLYVMIYTPPYVTATPNAFSIEELGAPVDVNLTFSGAGKADTFLVDNIMIASNDSLLGGGEIYSDTEYAKFHFVVTDTFYYAEWDTVTRTVRVTVSNVGNLGNEEIGNMMNYDGHDYLYDFTPVFVTPDIDGQGPQGYTWLRNRHDFLPEGHLGVIDYPNLKTTVSKDKFAPINPTLSPPWHWWWTGWTHYSLSMTSEYNFKIPPDTITIHNLKAIVVYNWWIHNPPPVWWCNLSGSSAPTGGYFGIAADWDVPSEASDKNIGGYNDTLNLIWLTSNDYTYDDYYGAFQFLEAAVTKGGITITYTAPFGAHVLTNAEQLYPLGGYDDDSLYKYMSTPGWSEGSDSAQDMNIVMSFIEELNPDTTTVIALRYALLLTDQGITEKNSISGIVRRVKPGDANVDGKVTVSDVVYLINYLFKGGPEPWKAYSDANGDERVTVSDVVYLINYLFKGGPPPILIWLETPPW